LSEFADGKGDGESLYEVLGVAEDASPDDIKRAYYRMVRATRPADNPEAFQRRKEAWEILSDPKRRGEYDQMRRFGAQVTALTDEATEYIRDEPQKAIRLLKQAAVLAPDLQSPRFLLAVAYMNDADFTRAETELRRLVGRDGRDANLRYHLAQAVYLQDGREAEAEGECRRALELNPAYYEAYLLLSRILHAEKRTSEAVEALEKAITLNGTEDFSDLSVLVRLLTIYTLEEDRAGMLKTESRIRAVIPNDDADAVHFAMGSLYDLAVDFFKAQNYTGADEIVQRIHHARLTDPELKESIHKAKSVMGTCADVTKMMDDTVVSRRLVHFWYGKYLDRDDEVTEAMMSEILDAVVNDALYNPPSFRAMLRHIRARYTRLAQSEADLLGKLDQMALEGGQGNTSGNVARRRLRLRCSFFCPHARRKRRLMVAPARPAIRPPLTL
jgi:curved DNA-binding protein CbpA